jgi:ABC-2 type transport system permease protein
MALFFFLVCGGIGFAKLGLAVALWAQTVDQLSAVGTFVLTPLIFLGGVFYSIDQLHPFWQTLSEFNPLLYLINGVRYGILGFGDVNPWFSAGVALSSVLGFHLILVFTLKNGSFQRW